MSPRVDAARPACCNRVRAVSFVDEALCNSGISVDAAVAEEGPMLACHFDFLQVALGDEHLFLVMRRLGDDLAKRIADERAAPEFNCAFDTNAVRRGDE